MKTLILSIILLSSLFGARVVETRWLKGQSFSGYLADRNASIGLIRNLDEDDRKFLSDIEGGVKFYELFDGEGVLLQALIPLGEEMQIQIVREGAGGHYSFDIVPINYVEREHKVVIPVEVNPHTDISRATNNRRLADKVYYFFKSYIDCRKLQKNDRLAMIYTQKERLGKPFGSPDIKVAMIETGKKKEFIYADERGLPYMGSCKTVTYDAKGKPVTAEEIRRLKRKQRFGMPLRHVRITSRFTYKRWHPILHRYRPHLGVDFGARRGTPLLAVNAGKVIFAGRKGGYGKVVKIKHRGGYVSLYAHQSRIRVKKGQQVKKGQVIGYVGSTGRSTGPHLHFGLYKNGRAVDPLKVLKKKSGGRLQRFITRKIEIKGARRNKARVIKMLKDPPDNYRWETIKANFVLIKDRAVYEQQEKGS
jgi:hypothetical protein